MGTSSNRSALHVSIIRMFLREHQSIEVSWKRDQLKEALSSDFHPNQLASHEWCQAQLQHQVQKWWYYPFCDQYYLHKKWSQKGIQVAGWSTIFRIGFILIECFKKVPCRLKDCTIRSPISNSLSQIQWALKFFLGSSSTRIHVLHLYL